jgi:phosphatidylglycerophosphatase A
MSFIKCFQVETPKSVWKNPIHFLAFGFGSGASPIAPGTAGTVVGVLFYLVLQPLNLLYYALAVISLFIIGCYLCGKTEKDVGVVDHSGIVWDEIVGYLVTMFAAPRGWIWIILGFILFRFFDITKFWPIKATEEKLSGGLAVMLDDIVAALYALFVLQSLVWVFGG